MKGIFCLLLLIGGLLTSALSQSPSPSLPQKSSDSSHAVPRYPSAQRLEAYRNNRDFNYERNPPVPTNPFVKFWYWFWDKVNDFLNSKSYESFWQYVIMVGIAGVGFWLLYKSDSLGFLPARRAQSAPLLYDTISENIHELDFNDLIEEAIQQRKYRLGVRLFYLKTLKHLTDQQYIQWQPTKTNRSYVQELQASALYRDFEKLTGQFEYVWYGDFDLSEEQFKSLQADFQDFIGRLSERSILLDKRVA